MAFSLWTNPGSNAVIVGDDGATPIWCEDCPCDSGCLPDIKERQQAYGITDAWSAGSPTDVTKLIDTTGTTTYTLLQLKAYVNNLCDGTAGAFIASSYTGGGALPSWLSSTYANSATNTAELCTLVLAMEDTRITPSVYTSSQDDWTGASFGEVSAAAAQAAAESDYSGYTGPGYSNFAQSYFFGGGTSYDATITLRRVKYQATGMTSALSKTVDFYTKPIGILNYDDLGKGPWTEGQNTLMDTAAAGTGVSAISDYFFSTTTPAWIAPDTSYEFVLSAPFAVLKWSFAN